MVDRCAKVCYTGISTGRIAVHDFEAILKEAHEKATAASNAHFAQHGESPFNCGFAWVTIAGTEPLARFCRKQENSSFYGSKGYPQGWQFWQPGEFGRQDVSCWRAGADAFARHLGETLGIRASVSSRLD